MTDLENNLENFQGCKMCFQSLNCGNLEMALNLIESHLDAHPNEHIAHELQSFKKDLKDLGFNYPNGLSACQIYKNPKLSKLLVENSIDILSMLQKAG